MPAAERTLDKPRVTFISRSPRYRRAVLNEQELLDAIASRYPLTACLTSAVAKALREMPCCWSQHAVQCWLHPGQVLPGALLHDALCHCFAAGSVWQGQVTCRSAVPMTEAVTCRWDVEVVNTTFGMPLREAISLMQETDLLIGMHGAGRLPP